ncbi:MAG TPA: tetraacyldisaccharide 4'-kinase [Vicinamibacterales bacterium]|nr:tetraacyldisaccharide 4'-kinase [Vicinamibacterales bacterium]
MLDSLYGQVMRERRRRIERRPERQRHLSKPVISVGNLSMGGTGKTPVVAAIAQSLIDAGHRPSILTRGYGREDALDGVVVIDGGTQIAQAGDEPMMLSRQVPGATVCVSPDRYLGGVLAEKLGCTVHVLDDGFQHIELARDLDILVTTIGEIPNGRVIPRGRLREPKDAAGRAHFLVVTDATAGAASAEAWALGISQSCGSLRRLAEPVGIRGQGSGIRDQGSGIRDQGSGIRDQKVLAVAGIANPDRFVASLRDAGWNVVDAMTFGDHHRYSSSDLAAIEAKMKSTGADVVFTTDKDAVRFDVLARSFPIYRVPLAVEFDPPAALFEAVKAVLR